MDFFLMFFHFGQKCDGLPGSLSWGSWCPSWPGLSWREACLHPAEDRPGRDGAGSARNAKRKKALGVGGRDARDGGGWVGGARNCC